MLESFLSRFVVGSGSGFGEVGDGAPGQRKGNGGHIVIRFAVGFDGLGNAGQIVHRDAARLAAALGCIVQDAVVFFAIAPGALVVGNAGVTCALSVQNAGLFQFHFVTAPFRIL